jgi:carbon-monoxide dehydrogenase small subunit
MVKQFYYTRLTGGMKKAIDLTINGERYHFEVETQETLLDVIRNYAGFTGTKEGCKSGECGACTVILNGMAVNSCLVLAVAANGGEIITIEGLGEHGKLHHIQEAFIDHGAVQCGFCIPGMILSAKVLLDRNPNPSEKEIKHAIAGNYCRCSGYVKIIEAIIAAGKSVGSRS